MLSSVFQLLSFAAVTGQSFGAPCWCKASSAGCGDSSQSLLDIVYSFAAGLINPTDIVATNTFQLRTGCKGDDKYYLFDQERDKFNQMIRIT